MTDRQPLPHTEMVLKLPHAPLEPGVQERLPQIAVNGVANICDGRTSLGTLRIVSPQQARAAKHIYVHELASLAETQTPLPDNLHAALQTKLNVSTLDPREHAYLAFGIPHSETLYPQALAQVAINRPTIRHILTTARQLGLAEFGATHHGTDAIATISSPAKTAQSYASDPAPKKAEDLALFAAYCQLHQTTPKDLPPYAPKMFMPQAALRKYLAIYGGPTIDEGRMRQHVARALIAGIHKEVFADQLFYPEPIKALGDLYQAELFFRTQQTPRGGYRTSRVEVARTQRGVDVYQVSTHGPNLIASRRAAARVVLRRIGATNLALQQ